MMAGNSNRSRRISRPVIGPICESQLEYFVNARVMGSEIHARARELLVAMLVMDAIFGIPGVAAAPIYYAYPKNELSARSLI
jgi:predicted PurR-regulated permease PerM